MSTIQHDEERARLRLEEENRVLEGELQDLESQEQALERRTSTLEASGGLGTIFGVIALVVSIIAIILALATKGTNTERVVTVAPGAAGVSSQSGATAGGSSAAAGMPMGASSAMHGSMMGVGDHGSFTASEVAAAKHGKVYVQLGEYWVAPTVTSVKSGSVTFAAKNVGNVPHELMIERAPIKFDAPNKPNEDAAQGMIDDMMHGQSGEMTVHLAPGTYVLFCNAPGHYEMGQHMVFKVTKS